jgi:oligopeptide/dipeptide ABC transporter ATP-binding protein
MTLLEVADLRVSYGRVQALRGVNLTADKGEVVGIVGESGCGKSTLAAALIALLPAGANATGAVRLQGRDILSLPERDKRAMRGRDIAMIFQDPMTSFSPVLTIGDQLYDFQHHLTFPFAEKRQRARAMLTRAGIADAEVCMRRYPHELSGGMRQRAAVAAALLMTPQVLVADEPTTALDVTMEAQILHLLRDLRSEVNGAIVIITHHLGVIGELCDRVYVMYAGQMVEQALVDDIYHDARHPYTRALIGCDPAHLAEKTPQLPTIPGRPPDLAAPPKGCAFAARCVIADAHCAAVPPPDVRISPTHAALCHKVTA